MGLITTTWESSSSWKLSPLGKSRWRNSLFLVERHPAIAARLIDDEFIGGGLDAQAEIAAFQQRAFVQQVRPTPRCAGSLRPVGCRAR